MIIRDATRNKAAITAAAALDAHDQRLFVGREQEIVRFAAWLERPNAPFSLLNVSGPGGVGKSTLLRAFARVARGQDLQVVHVDGQNLSIAANGGMLPGFARAAGVVQRRDGHRARGSASLPTAGVIAAALNREPALLVIDAVDEADGLDTFLRAELLPRLEEQVRVVIAGRDPLGPATGWRSPWTELIERMSLAGLSAPESREYLSRRELDAQAVDQALHAAGGHPLALSLAADLVQHLGVRDLAAATEWHLSLRVLVDQLLKDVRDPALRALLDAAAVLRTFDATALAAVSGEPESVTAFERLCHLSIVRPAERGLALHTDLGRLLANDLRWRRPEHYAVLRGRALAHYRQRMHHAAPAEREWLLRERMALWGNGLLQAMAFAEPKPDQFRVEPARPEDIPGIMEVWGIFSSDVQPSSGSPAAQALVRGMIERQLAASGTRARVVRGPDGAIFGFTSMVPICRQTMPLFMAGGIVDQYIRVTVDPRGVEALPDAPEDTNISTITGFAYRPAHAQAVQALLLRDLLGVFASGGHYFAPVTIPALIPLIEALGFAEVEEARSTYWNAQQPARVYALDLTRVGVEVWLDALITGRPTPRALPEGEVAAQVQAVLEHWHDDARLAASPLARLPAAYLLEPPVRGAASVRRLIDTALRMPSRRAADAETLQALLLLRDEPQLTADEAARRLAVSRSTYYRLLRRGTRMLAHRIVRGVHMDKDDTRLTRD